jgi:hypothetical protein
VIIIPLKVFQVQVYNFLKGADPVTHILIHGGDEQKAANGEAARVVSGSLRSLV